MFRVLAFLGFLVAGNFLAAETAEQLNQQLAQIHGRTSAAGKFAQLAKYVIDNESKALESNDSLTQQFEEMRQNQGESSLIVFRAIATKEEAATARAYYLGVRDNLLAAQIVVAFEIMALQASSDEVDNSTRASLSGNLAATFDSVKEMLKESTLKIPDVQKLSIDSQANAIAARTYYAGVKDNLIARAEAMGRGESFG